MFALIEINYVNSETLKFLNSKTLFCVDKFLKSEILKLESFSVLNSFGFPFDKIQDDYEPALKKKCRTLADFKSSIELSDAELAVFLMSCGYKESTAQKGARKRLTTMARDYLRTIKESEFPLDNSLEKRFNRYKPVANKLGLARKEAEAKLKLKMKMKKPKKQLDQQTSEAQQEEITFWKSWWENVPVIGALHGRQKVSDIEITQFPTIELMRK